MLHTEASRVYPANLCPFLASGGIDVRRPADGPVVASGASECKPSRKPAPDCFERGVRVPRVMQFPTKREGICRCRSNAPTLDIGRLFCVIRPSGLRAAAGHLPLPRFTTAVSRLVLGR